MKLFLSDLISNLGDILYYLALMNFIVETHMGNWVISILTLSESIPILLSFILGYFADKTIRRIDTIKITLILRFFFYTILMFVIGTKHSLLIVLVAIIVNFFSDILGQFENLLYYPIYKRVIEDEDREEFQSFKQTTQISLSVLFQGIGGILIMIMSYKLLAFINAMTFLISLLIVKSLTNQLNPILETNASPQSRSQPESFKLSQLFAELKESVNLLKQIDEISVTLVSVPLLNSGIAVLYPMILLFLSQDQTFSIVNTETTLSLFLILETCGSILGGYLTMTLKRLKNWTITRTLIFEIIAMLVLFLAFWIHNIYIVLVGIFTLELLNAIINPKFNTKIYNNLNEEKLGVVFGGMVTYFSIGDFLSRILFSILILLLSPSHIALIYVMVSVCLLIYLLKGKIE